MLRFASELESLLPATMRSTAAQPPMTGCLSDWRICESGTWMAIECTLKPARLSVPLPPTPIRSKIRPTSIANGSSLGPT